MMVSKRLLPVLHASSFNAWKSLPVQGGNERDRDQLIAEGYRSQVELLAVPCEAVLQRAVEECVPIILEGVHVHPDLLARAPKDSDVITVHITLAVLKSKELKSRLRGRGVEVPQRRAKRYLNNFDSIWRRSHHPQRRQGKNRSPDHPAGQCGIGQALHGDTGADIWRRCR